MLWQLPLALGCLAWLALGGLLLREILALRWLEDLAHAPPSAWPRLSVLIPACNEALTLEPALQSLLAQDYPDLEVVLVNDRSTDGTGALVDRLAAADARVQALHIATLPPGWLGKLHALHVAMAQATGDVVLLTDADVHFGPQALRRTVAWFQAEQLDHLTLLPRVHVPGLGGAALVTAFGAALLAAMRPSQVGRPGSGACVGIGAFNLVRKATFARTPGFPWLKLEIVDDLGVAQLLRDVGGRSAVGVSRRLLALTWYDDMHGMVRGLEKNMFAAIARFSYARAILVAAAMFGFGLAPVVALVLGPTWLRLLAALGLTCTLGPLLALARRGGTPLAGVLLLPFAQVLAAATLLRSAWKTWRQGGVVWRGTRYTTAELRAGQRVQV